MFLYDNTHCHIATKVMALELDPFSHMEYSRLLFFAPNNNFRHAIDSNKMKSNDSSNYSSFFYDKTNHLSEREIMVIIKQVKQLMTK